MRLPKPFLDLGERRLLEKRVEAVTGEGDAS